MRILRKSIKRIRLKHYFTGWTYEQNELFERKECDARDAAPSEWSEDEEWGLGLCPNDFFLKFQRKTMQFQLFPKQDTVKICRESWQRSESKLLRKTHDLGGSDEPFPFGRHGLERMVSLRGFWVWAHRFLGLVVLAFSIAVGSGEPNLHSSWHACGTVFIELRVAVDVQSQLSVVSGHAASLPVLNTPL